MYEITQNTIVDQILGACLRGASLYRHYNVYHNIGGLSGMCKVMP